MSSQLLRLAVVGFGHQTQSDHLPVIENNSNLELSAIVDPFIKQHYLNVPIYNSLSDLNKGKTRYDAVLVAVPHAYHHTITVEALNSKKHVFKEKPAALNLSELQNMISLSQKHKLHLMVNAQRRLFPHVEKAKSYLSEIGNIFLIEGCYKIFVDHPEIGWRGSKETAGGGCILDMGYHLIDLLIYLLGIPDRITARASTDAVSDVNYTAEDTATILFEYQKQYHAHGSMTISRFCGPKDELLRIVGSQGIVEIRKDGTRLLKNDGSLIQFNHVTVAEQPLDHFVNVLLYGSENKLDVRSHLDSVRFIESCYESMRLQKSVILE